MAGGPPASLVDTHCHLDLYPDPASVVAESERNAVYTIAVTNAPSVFDRNCAIVGASSRYVRVALGLHPELAAERSHELQLFRERLSLTRYVGEVGLDYVTSDESQRATQRRILEAIVAECDSAGGKVLTVHSRRAAEDVVDVFGSRFRGTYILHWYAGGVKALRRALAHGAYVSVNTPMMGSKRTRALVAEVPRERVLTETDGPFVQVADRTSSAPARPVNVERVIAELARMWAVHIEDARATVYANFASMLRANANADSRPP
jgi:TatD DNase family protein